MRYSQSSDTFFVYLEKEEKVMETLTEFCVRNNIYNGKLSGIGAVKSIEIGAYDINDKQYIRRSFDEVLELISFQGNITLKDDLPFIHAHITVGDSEMKIHGGHLFEMKVAVVGEFIIEKYEGNVIRIMNDEIGLPVCTFQNER